MKLCDYVIITFFVGIVYHLSKIYHLKIDRDISDIY